MILSHKPTEDKPAPFDMLRADAGDKVPGHFMVRVNIDFDKHGTLGMAVTQAFLQLAQGMSTDAKVSGKVIIQSLLATVSLCVAAAPKKIRKKLAMETERNLPRMIAHAIKITNGVKKSLKAVSHG